MWPEPWRDMSTFTFGYFAIGVACLFALEHWNFEDSLYFLTQSCLTVGYGDIVPRKPESRIFCAIYVPIGIPIIFRSALSFGRSIVASVTSSYPASCTAPPLIQDDKPIHDVWTCLRVLPGLLFVIGIGVAVGHYVFAMDLIDAIWFFSTSAYTQGYGDVLLTGRLKMILMVFYLFAGCGTFAAVAEVAYLTLRGRDIKSLNHILVIDQLLMQEGPWDRTVGGKQVSFAAKADVSSEGLSEAEFMLSVLIGHNLVDVSTLVEIRRQYALMLQAAARSDPRTTNAIVAAMATEGRGGDGAMIATPAVGGSSMSSGVASSTTSVEDSVVAAQRAAAEHAPIGAASLESIDVRADFAASLDLRRLDVHAVYAILLGEQRVLQRPADMPVGSTQEEAQREGEVVARTPIALVDLHAHDGGFEEWHTHFWRKKLVEERNRVGVQPPTVVKGNGNGTEMV